MTLEEIKKELAASILEGKGLKNPTESLVHILTLVELLMSSIEMAEFVTMEVAEDSPSKEALWDTMRNDSAKAQAHLDLVREKLK